MIYHRCIIDVVYGYLYQVISKYTARFALGLSNSRPAVEFDEQNIYFIDDISKFFCGSFLAKPHGVKPRTTGPGIRKVLQPISL